MTNHSKQLDELINLLKFKQIKQFDDLKQQLQTTEELLKPTNILKNMALEVKSILKTETSILTKMVNIVMGEIKNKRIKLIRNNKVGVLLEKFL